MLIDIPSCDLCRDYKDDDGNLETYVETDSAFQALRDSSEHGCDGCFILWQFARHFVKRCRGPRGSGNVLLQKDFENGGPQWLTLAVQHTPQVCCGATSGDTAYGPDMTIFSTDGNIYRLGPLEILPGVRMDSLQFLAESSVQIRQWLDDCRETHVPSCGIDGPKRLPTRVLDLGLDKQSEDDISLYEPDTNETGQYVCLSHCWGPHGCSLKTTALNFRQHKQNICFSTLPLTFQEAVVFTRWLGVRYLWIDALCIIQGDEADWSREAIAMASVYSGSYLTLSAASAAQGSDGLYKLTARDFVQKYIHYRQGRVVHRNRFFMRTRIRHDVLNGTGTWQLPIEDAYNNFPLLARAWAFQERILSPRVVHFGSQEVYWECRSLTSCECGNLTAIDAGKEIFSGMVHQSDDIHLMNRIVRWKYLVRLFSEKLLTFQSDRLPAIAGLARSLSVHMPQARYLAGIWSSDPFALLWYVTWTLSTFETPQHSCPWPSWSWVKVNGSVIYYNPKPSDVSYCQVVGANGDFDYGHVRDGELVVRGRKELVTWSNHESAVGFQTRLQFRTLSVCVDQVPSFYLDDPRSTLEAQSFHLLLLASTENSIFFMILQQVTEENPDTPSKQYRRVGMYVPYGIGNGTDLLAKASFFDQIDTFRIV